MESGEEGREKERRGRKKCKPKYEVSEGLGKRWDRVIKSQAKSEVGE